MGALIGLDARMAGPVPSGLGTYASQLARALTRLDAAHTYVIIRQRLGQSSMAAGPNVTEIVVDGDIDAPVNLARGGAISRLGLDLYHSLHHFLPLRLRVPRVVLTLHDLIWVEHRRLIRSGRFAPFSRTVTNLYARAAMGYAVRRADRIIAISEHTAARAAAVFNLARARIDVIPHGVDGAAFPAGDPDVTPATRVETPPYFLCVSNTRPYKNIPTALRAFALCAASTGGQAADPESVRLIISGRGDSTGELRRLAQRLGVERRVSFTGPLSQPGVLQLLHGARALLFPSIVEGFGFPVLEAMSAGCPVIASRAPAVLDVAGDAALCCDADDPEAFAVAMRRVLGEPGLHARLRQAGVSRARIFTWDRTAARTLAVYERLLAER
ncbi:MAG TPA: glycosyltransferase family 1 protein [Vicinamibacterales bacterium]|nr:glycosyltransferase family 1 protein [Vicinamibacterales bacterium]